MIVIASLAAAPASGAGRTEVGHFVFDETAPDPTTSEYCGFPVESRAEGTLNVVTTLAGPASSRFHEVTTGPVTITATNTLTGASIKTFNTISTHAQIVQT